MKTVALPDQDWIAFGFWLTAPNDAKDGTHRMGVFYDGMDMYGYTGCDRMALATPQTI